MHLVFRDNRPTIALRGFCRRSGFPTSRRKRFAARWPVPNYLTNSGYRVV
jgi:hypothetical protein